MVKLSGSQLPLTSFFQPSGSGQQRVPEARKKRQRGDVAPHPGEPALKKGKTKAKEVSRNEVDVIDLCEFVACASPEANTSQNSGSVSVAATTNGDEPQESMGTRDTASKTTRSTRSTSKVNCGAGETFTTLRTKIIERRPETRFLQSLSLHTPPPTVRPPKKRPDFASQSLEPLEFSISHLPDQLPTPGASLTRRQPCAIQSSPVTAGQPSRSQIPPRSKPPVILVESTPERPERSQGFWSQYEQLSSLGSPYGTSPDLSPVLQTRITAAGFPESKLPALSLRQISTPLSPPITDVHVPPSPKTSPAQSPVQSPVRFVPSSQSQSQYLHFSPQRPRGCNLSADTVALPGDEVLQSSQSQTETELCIDTTLSHPDLSEWQSIGRAVHDHETTSNAADAASRGDPTTMSQTYDDLECSCQLTFPHTRPASPSPGPDSYISFGEPSCSLPPTSPASIPAVLESNTLYGDDDDDWATLPTQLRVFERMFDDDRSQTDEPGSEVEVSHVDMVKVSRNDVDEAERLSVPNTPCPVPAAAPLSDDGSLTEPESSSDLFAHHERLRQRDTGATASRTGQKDGATSDLRLNRTIDRRIQAVIDRMSSPQLYGSDDYQAAGAALSIPSSDGLSLRTEQTIGSCCGTLPDAVRDFVDMFED